jgi:hypothetical protein
MGESRGVKKRNHLEDPGLVRIILRWIFTKWAVKAWN